MRGNLVMALDRAGRLRMANWKRRSDLGAARAFGGGSPPQEAKLAAASAIPEGPIGRAPADDGTSRAEGI